MAKRIEIYTSFEEAADATRQMYLAMSPIERWHKLMELYYGIKAHPEIGAYCLYPLKTQQSSKPK